jgi:hypothetical protein
MDNIDKYFQDILDKLNKLKAERKYHDAIELIEQELSSSYIPLRFIQTFEQLYVEISRESMVYDIKQKFNKMSKTEMLANIYKDNKIDLNVLSFFLSKFLKEIDQYDLQYLNKIFMDKNLTNNEKIFILSQLKIAQIKYQFTFLNNITNESFSIDPSSNFEIQYQSYYRDVNKLIDQDLMKEPSLIVLAKNLLQIIYEHFFNREPIMYSIQALANNLVLYVKKHFDASIEVDKTFEQ